LTDLIGNPKSFPFPVAGFVGAGGIDKFEAAVKDWAKKELAEVAKAAYDEARKNGLCPNFNTLIKPSFKTKTGWQFEFKFPDIIITPP